MKTTRSFDKEKFSRLREEDLPEYAYALLHTSRDRGDCIIVKRGMSGYFPTDWPKGKYTPDIIDELNEGLGVSAEEAEMLYVKSFRAEK